MRDVSQRLTVRDALPSCRGTATSSETALAEMIVIFSQTGLLEQCRWHMYGLGVLVQVPLNFPERLGPYRGHRGGKKCGVGQLHWAAVVSIRS